jgi:hypothetical protein
MLPKSFWSELSSRIARPLCAVPLFAGVASIITLAILASDQTAWGDPHPARFVMLPLLAGALLAVGSFQWLRRPKERAASSTCLTCGFELRGHADPPEKCPECGEPPTAFTHCNSATSWVAMFPGILLILAAVGCLLFASIYASLWVSGTFDI